MGERPGVQHCGEGSFPCELFPHNFNYFPENICEHTHDVNVCMGVGGNTASSDRCRTPQFRAQLGHLQSCDLEYIIKPL